MTTTNDPSLDHAPIGPEEAARVAEVALEQPGVDGLEVMIAGSSTGLTRFAGSEIIQNTARDEIQALVRAFVDGRTGTATTNQLSTEHLRAATARAAEAARASRPDPELPPLPVPDEIGRAEGLLRFDDATATASPELRARAVRDMLAASSGDSAAGIYETSAHCYSVFSSAGVRCYDAFTRCVATCLVDTGSSTGWGEASSYAAAEVDVEEAVGRSVDKAHAARDSTDVDPGAYQVVLEAPAAATLLEYLAYVGFGAKQVIEGTSFLASRTGDDVADPTVTVVDDASHPRSVGIAFDFQGVPRRRVEVISRGRAAGPVTDLRTGPALGLEPTGHFSGSHEYGPYAANVVMEPGGASLEELVSGIDDGLLVTRLHYVNVLDRPTTLLTGMTRDGLFRISNGEVAGAVNNLRFTQSVLEALASVEAIGAELAAFAPEYGSFGSTVAPAVRVGEFHFTSRTSH